MKDLRIICEAIWGKFLNYDYGHYIMYKENSFINPTDIWQFADIYV